jgi:hypothetical protein
MDLVAIPPITDLRSSGLSLSNHTRQAIETAIVGLDSWFDSMRLPGGYGGPVAHWWDDCLKYQGPGLDWRYEGIINGYLNLWESTGDMCWMSKARRAGDDLLSGQLPSGNFRNSKFELNPGTGGTPHEAACDQSLLRLADVLRTNAEGGWESYSHAARRNLQDYFIAHLWSEGEQTFFDSTDIYSFVPNKAATLVEALFAMTRINGDDRWIQVYAIPTLETVVAHQVIGGELDGALYQNRLADRKIDKFFPFYIARCLPAVLEGYSWTGDERFVEAARRAANFVLRCRYADGSFPQVIYPRGRLNRYPQWVAAVGDILRTLDLLLPFDLAYDPQPSLDYLLAGRRQDGGFHTAVGFGKITPFGKHNDPRDEMSVCGWADKAFRYLTRLVATHKLSERSVMQSKSACTSAQSS